ncbi:MAG: acyl-CoA dehydrogenase family protein [Candidatus Parcubacteria bacterium]|nr:acyl-CoA dehydrogenase family protein [Burkholderiales bacterium]
MLPQLPASHATAAHCETVADWWPRHRAIAAAHVDPIHQAIVGGFVADRVGWAFASGYQAALRALFPDTPADRICALCVTEAGGNSPKAIRSSLRRDGADWVLDGSKRWATLGQAGALFFVAARDEAASGERAAIRIARVDSKAKGLKIENMPAAKFVPEVPHAQLHFTNLTVREEQILPGDGYDQYVKPFRTVEDIHVQAAVLAYLMREGQRLSWPQHWLERLSALLAALGKLADMPAAEAETHIALAGALAIGAGLIAETEAYWLAAATDPAALRWRRDRELLAVAAGAREQRTRRAWEVLKAAQGPKMAP